MHDRPHTAPHRAAEQCANRIGLGTVCVAVAILGTGLVLAMLGVWKAIELALELAVKLALR